jgi:3-dehydroquinate dehydratase / shikimate dehydrogenase
MMICVVIKGPSLEDVYRQISAAFAYADLVELRLDCFALLDMTALKKLRSHFSIPMIFTLRSQQQGGSYPQSEENRLIEICRLCALKPEYLDLESHVSPSFIKEIASQYPEIKVILSHHDFETTPKNLDKLYQKMKIVPAHFYKIAVTPQNCLDAMRFVCWANKTNDQLIAISMGSHGQLSRILGPMIGTPITYAALEEDLLTAPGQLSAKTLIEQYHHRSLNRHSALYGLIGDPVDQSISAETHNHLFTTCGFNAVYVKIQVKTSELAEFLNYAKQLPFRGFSVTMPLKESILPYLDGIDPRALDIGAVNTLLFEDNKINGFNTDGIGALNALENEGLVKDKRVIIIGAGGAARAIAYEAKQRGSHVTLVNRDKGKALQIAQRLHCTGKGLEDMVACAQEGYDILINCTPVALPIASDYILPQAVVMDIVTKPKDTPFLKQAMEKGCQVIYGYEMFIEQAIEQFNLWFKNRIDFHESRQILENKAKECVLD